MVRALAFCVVVLAACTAAAQTVRPRIVSQPETEKKLGIEAQAPTPVVACEEDECPNATAVASADKAVDKHALLKQKLAELNCLQSEIDALRAETGTPQQILLKLKVIEISRTKLRQSGIDIGLLQKGDAESPLSQATAETSPFSGFTTINDAAAMIGLIEQLQKNNIAKVLTEPNVVAVSGRPAQFNVGGELPIPLPKGSKQAVEYKPFGTQVDLLAITQGDNRVRLELRARIGHIDDSRKIDVDGVTVPSIDVRQIDTGLDLRIGQTGVLSGMLETRTERQKRGDNVVDVENQIELLFLVTPELVAPLDSPRQASTRDAAVYRTATSDSQERPGERSLRVTKSNSR